MSGPGWGTTSATVMGSMHVRLHLPNQDSARTWVSDDGASAVIAVADGHGHHAHFRSDVGADLATRCALDALRRALPHPDPAAVAATIVGDWRDAVAAHLEAEPLPADQRVSDPLLPYGATLLALAVTDTHLVSLQVGDGDTVAVRASGETFRPLPDDPDLDGIHTASLCQPDPLSSLRHTTVALHDDPIALAYLCTDGFGKARVDADGWWRTTGTELVGFVRDRGLTWVAEQLPDWLDEPARIGGDDTTLALVARVAVTVAPAATTTPAPAPETVPITLPDVFPDA